MLEVAALPGPIRTELVSASTTLLSDAEGVRLGVGGESDFQRINPGTGKRVPVL